MGPGLIHFSPRHTDVFQLAVSDLDIAGLLCAEDKNLTAEKASSFVETYYSTEAEEIQKRSAFLEDCQNATALTKAQHLAEELVRDTDNLSRTSGKLSEVAYLLRRAKNYLALTEALADMLVMAPRGERAVDLKAFLDALRSDKQYLAIQKTLSETEEYLRLPRHIYVGINIKEDYSPTEFSIVKTDDTEDKAPVNSLLSPEDVSKASSSLSPEFFYTGDLYGNHFDEYFAMALEKELHSELIKAQKALSALTLSALDYYMGLCDVLYFYRLGKAFEEKMQALGAKVTTPNPNGTHLSAKKLLYPALVLNQSASQSQPIPNDVDMTDAAVTVITGANHSGKTSYLKTVGQCLCLAQLGFKVPAESFTFKPFRDFYTLFSAGEDDSMDVSRMGVEIQKITDIVGDAQAGDLIFLNEPLTSTNPLEAVAICAELCERFYDKGATVLLVTHLYDVYYVLNNHLHIPTLKSLITNSVYDEKSGHMSHSFVIREAEPEGHSYARETAVDFGITLEAMIADSCDLKNAADYLSRPRKSSLYENDSIKEEK